MSSPIFDSTFGTGRFKHEEPMTTDLATSPSPEPQDVRSLAREAADTISRELAELGVRVPDDLREPIASEIRKVIRAALAQSDAGQEPGNDFPDCIEKTLANLYTAPPRPDASGLIEAAEWHDKQVANCNKYLKQSPADHILLSIREEHKASAGYFRSRAADRSVHSELIPDCPTDGVAARQGNGG